MPAIAPHILRLLSSRVCRRIFRIDTKINNLKIASNTRSQILQCLDQTVVDQWAKHRASVIAGHKNSRLAFGLIAEAEWPPIFVAKNEIV